MFPFSFHEPSDPKLEFGCKNSYFFPFVQTETDKKKHSVTTMPNFYALLIFSRPPVTILFGQLKKMVYFCPTKALGQAIAGAA